MNEIWKPVIGLEDYYQVSNLGRIKSLDRLVNSRWNTAKRSPGKILKPGINKWGYRIVNLYKKGRIFRLRMCRIVLSSFNNKPENKKLQCNHKDFNKLNDDIKNLEWVTPSQNQLHAFRVGKRKVWNKGKKKVWPELLCEFCGGRFIQKRLRQIFCTHKCVRDRNKSLSKLNI